ncbi:tetratricopeptide repeat protein [Phaeovulum vinaykumarii]|uniref:tetratricopeptide repeat protein n=1 Tax=Phaeovulum vinaykumarii TaxID=407234 RepID=UPI0038B3903D
MQARARAALGALVLAGALGGCAGAVGPGGDSPFAPGASGGDAVDGLTVGHRLMAAGEYELALKAYYRAAAEEGATVDVLSAIGSANLKLGRLGTAERVLRRATEADDRFVPAWNNLGVVLMEKGEVAEARRIFQLAYALDSGQSDAIRENLRRAIAKLDKPRYDPTQEEDYALVRRGAGSYLLLTRD